MSPILGFVASLGAALVSAAPAPEVAADRPRVVVLTDVGSLTAGVAEPDDGQSLIRLMLYTNDLDVRGLVATSNLEHGRKVRPDLIHRVIDAYADVRPNLLLHDDRYPPAEALHQVVKAGRPAAGLKVPVEDCVGEGLDTEGSDWLIQVADQPGSRPLWILAWGGTTELAQALWKVRRDRGEEGLAAFAARLRLHAIGDQDSTGPWIRDQFPALFTIVQRRAYRGMYRGGDTGLCSSSWVRRNIHGHGALGDLYPDYDGGDIWGGALGPVRGIKEGDTPSFLALLPNGLTDLDRPERGSWGGRFEGEGNRLTDVPDADLVVPDDPDPRMSSVHRWRPAFQAEFQARLDWCVKPFAEADHAPVVRLDDRERRAEPGSVVFLDASGSTDPDGGPMDFHWTVHPADPELIRQVALNADGPRARVVLPPALAGRTIPILLTVSDRGAPNLARYARVLLRVRKPSE